MRRSFKALNAGFKTFRNSLAWPLLKFVILSMAGFTVLISGLSYLTLALDSFLRKQRRFKFPHRSLAPVEVDGHQLQIFNYGQQTFGDMLKAIDDATETIFLETYILKGDSVGKRFKAKLIEKANQGVKVCLAFDGFGSLLMPLGFKRWPKNVQVQVYGPINSYLNFFLVHTYIRDHRKILVVDGRIAYLGGMNIGREYARTWRDSHLRIDGPKAQQIALAFCEMWNKPGSNRKSQDYLRLPYQIQHDATAPLFFRESKRSSVFGPLSIQHAYLEAIQQAQNYIKLTNPYFLPDRLMVNELLGALRRGVRVDLLVPQKSNHSIVDLLARPIYDRLIKAGAHLWLYQHTVIHSKTATIDGLWSTIGSANLDGRSLINYEINAFIVHAGFAERMEEMFEDDRQNCLLAAVHQFDHPSLLRRCLELIALPLRPFV